MRPEWRRHHGRFPRHWLFVRVMVVLVMACAALAVAWSLATGPHLLRHLGMALGILAVSGFILRRMFRPLQRLLHGVREIASGNLDFQFTRRYGGEVGYLARQFNHMARRVKEMVASRERLLLDVSHELRSPLTRLKLALAMSPQGRMRDAMLQDLAEMETMVTEILETHRLKTRHGKLHLVELDLVAVARDLAQGYAGRRPGVRLVRPPASLGVRADEARIRTVLRNVVENALKYSSRQSRPVELGMERRGAATLVTIRDFGIGIPPAERARVFEPFYRVDRSRSKETGGYGLGLSLCREIMRAHGGRIDLAPARPRGTLVTLRFAR